MTTPRTHRTDATPPAIPLTWAVVLHGALLAVLVHWHPVAIAPMRLPGTASGSHLSLTYLPGRPPASPAPQVVRRRAPEPVPSSLRAPIVAQQQQQASLSTASTSSAIPDATNGNDALGTGNINIALAAVFPAPKPDLSALPPGTSGDVVLDIVIDAAGKVSGITMSRGLGHGIDEAVIATVQQWSFHPATRDGQPVPSEQELHFHYEKA